MGIRIGPLEIAYFVSCFIIIPRADALVHPEHQRVIDLQPPCATNNPAKWQTNGFAPDISTLAAFAANLLLALNLLGQSRCQLPVAAGDLPVVAWTVRAGLHPVVSMFHVEGLTGLRIVSILGSQLDVVG